MVRQSDHVLSVVSDPGGRILAERAYDPGGNYRSDCLLGEKRGKIRLLLIMPSLSDRLKSLGVKVGAQDLPPPKKRAAYPIEHVIPGEFLDTPYGQAFVVETRYPGDHRQGIAAVRFRASLRSIAAWAGESRLLECDPGSFIFLDTETSGLAGGTGTYAFLIGVGRLEAKFQPV